MNTILKDWHPRLFSEAEEKLGRPWEEVFPYKEYYQIMHLGLFPKGIVHAENLGGEIDSLSNRRIWIGAFPWRAIELESCICRIAAFDFSAE